MTPPYFIAEMSANHLGRLERALAIVQAAKAAGADAIKFQTFTPSQMVDNEAYLANSGPWPGMSLLALYEQAHMPRSWHPELFAAAENIGLKPFSSVFHPDDVDFLETLNCQAYKISSFELTDICLIQHAAATKKPLIMSTGMATRREIEHAVHAAYGAGATQITLLKCTSAYPAPPDEANLQAMPGLWNIGRCAYGLSDHTTTHTSAICATVLGAKMIEKHFTIRPRGGPDAAFSLVPEEFAAMVNMCREAAASMGSDQFGPTPSESAMLHLRRPPGGKRGQG